MGYCYLSNHDCKLILPLFSENQQKQFQLFKGACDAPFRISKTNLMTPYSMKLNNEEDNKQDIEGRVNKKAKVIIVSDEKSVVNEDDNTSNRNKGTFTFCFQPHKISIILYTKLLRGQLPLGETFSNS